MIVSQILKGIIITTYFVHSHMQCSSRENFSNGM